MFIHYIVESRPIYKEKSIYELFIWIVKHIIGLFFVFTKMNFRKTGRLIFFFCNCKGCLMDITDHISSCTLT